jgi:hypothetical protein
MQLAVVRTPFFSARDLLLALQCARPHMSHIQVSLCEKKNMDVEPKCMSLCTLFYFCMTASTLLLITCLLKE